MPPPTTISGACCSGMTTRPASTSFTRRSASTESTRVLTSQKRNGSPRTTGSPRPSQRHKPAPPPNRTMLKHATSSLPSSPAAMAARAPLDRAARAARIHQILDELHPMPGSPLAHETPYQLLVATILSAQCTDARVSMVTPALFAVAPDAHAMAKLKPREVLEYVKTCGLAKGKAKNVVAMSKALVANHGGAVPQDFAALAAFPVDTHIHRLAGRWGRSRARNV